MRHVKMGRTLGLFDTAEELIASMRREGKKLPSNKKKANS
jgi:hypothetical protein